MKLHYSLITLVFLIIISGCSKSGPVLPAGDLSQLNALPSGIGLLGSYELTVNMDTMEVELTPKRMSSLGESFIVSGLEYFNSKPCTTCLDFIATGMDIIDGDVILFFNLEHPFQQGDPGQPPSAVNRLDLDIFDTALVIWDVGVSVPINFPLTNTIINSVYVTNASGYTTELANLIDTPAAPYVLVNDDSISGQPATYNEFPMGGSDLFPVELAFIPGEILTFDLFLTFGYGASATYDQRLNPQYYNPEFNRKAAWKVEVTPPAFPWRDQDDTTLNDVTVIVYDWQAGHNVNPNLDNPEDIFAASEVLSVTVEVPGMNATLPIVNVPDFGSGRPQDPFIYTVWFANENKLGAGQYVGLVKVTDSRSPLAITEGRDFLIDTRDGIQRDQYEMDEYGTYQVFEAQIAVI